MATNQLDFSGLSFQLLSRARILLPKWLPGGTLKGQEYMCGDITGGPGDSFRVNVRTGAWCDFANPDQFRGGDLISLWAAINNIGQGEAAKQLASEVGFQLIAAKTEVPEIIPPPLDKPVPQMLHQEYGKPSMHWCYRTEKDDVLFYIARYDPVGGKKQIIPWTWSTKGSRYTMKSWPTPRPLYGLELLSLRPEAPIMLVEGEKACDSARRLASGPYIVMCWPNGGNSYNKVDFSPIYGRKILLWPDADEPGLKAMAGVARILKDHSPEIKVIDPSDHSKGWDAADAINDGWNGKDFFAWAKTRVRLLDEAEVLPKEDWAEPVEEEDNGTASNSAMITWQRAELVLTRQGQPIVNLDNIMRLFKVDEHLQDLVWYDEFHGRYFTKGENGKARQWTEHDDSELTIYLQRILDIRKVPTTLVAQAAMTWGRQHPKNEPKDWMETLEWDKAERIERFFIEGLGAEDSAFTRAASRNFWISLAARIYSPGCKADEMIVLEGAQGTYKSTALSVIGGDWYSQASARPGEKDFYQGLQGKLLIEIAELSSFSKVDINIIKKDLSNASDDIRVSYGRYNQKYPRTCIFAGSTNESAYLNDPTGGRRFWPIKVGKIDLIYIRENRNLFFAEAVHCLKAGASWHEMPMEETLMQQESRQILDAWIEDIGPYLAFRESACVTLRDIWVDCLKGEVDRFDPMAQKRVARCFHQLGWDRRVRRVGGKNSKVWVKIGESDKSNGNGSGEHTEKQPDELSDPQPRIQESVNEIPF
jgi:predicted P-loop ATPase